MDEQAEKARRYFRSALESFMAENPGASVAEVREYTLDLFGVALPNFTDLTGTLACDLFDEIAEECSFEGERARLYDTTDYQVVEGKVRYFAGFLADGDVDRFKREVADITRYFCKRAAFDNMVENCRAQKVKWARMPTGFETCPFCFMLSSRGFVYASEKTASEGHHGYHDNCDCVVVPGFQDERGNPRVRIDGYDPETMYRNWSMCEKSIGGREQARAEWLALSGKEREGYIDRHGDASKAFGRFEQNRIRNEVATRDWHWLYTGVAPKYQVLDGAKPSDEEKETANRLALSGYRSVFRPTRSRESKRTSDVFFDNGTYKAPWEYKNPKGDGNQTVSHQFEEAAGQSKNLVIDSQLLGKSWTDERLIDEAKQKLNRKKGFKVERGQHKGETWFFDQVIVVLKDKTTVKLRRG